MLLVHLSNSFFEVIRNFEKLSVDSSKFEEHHHKDKFDQCKISIRVELFYYSSRFKGMKFFFHRLACECIAKGKKQGSKAFSLGDYEECCGTADTAKLSSFLKDQSQVSNGGCLNSNYQQCAKGGTCMGGSNMVYIYTTAG